MVGVKRKAEKVIHKNSKYFFLNDILHRRFAINRQTNLIVAWDFTNHVKVTYMYSDYLKKRQPAFTIGEAGKLCNRSYWRTYHVIFKELEMTPHKAYNPGKDTDWYQYYVSPEQVMVIYDYYASVRQGIKQTGHGKRWLKESDSLPLRQEVLGAMNLHATHYIEDEEGNLIPVFRAK